jgi:tRNA pseudouridine32 synthase/23S rRNA pseudouridine746 synthase
MQVPGLTAEEIQARVLHRDGLMLVIDKPAGLPVHRGPKGGANLEASFDALRFGLPRPPVLAHRLDKDTSGCLVLGRHRKATASLGLLFKHGKIAKTYWAVVEGGPAADEGTIDLPLGRLNVERGWWQKPDPDGQKAVTNWKVLGRGEGLAWLALEPVTGRTHQLRVHSAAQGWPIFGDNIYGNGPRFGEPRLHLHSRELVIPISRNKDPVRVVAPAPAHMHEKLGICGWRGSSFSPNGDLTSSPFRPSQPVFLRIVQACPLKMRRGLEQALQLAQDEQCWMPNDQSSTKSKLR